MSQVRKFHTPLFLESKDTSVRESYKRRKVRGNEETSRSFSSPFVGINPNTMKILVFCSDIGQFHLRLLRVSLSRTLK